MKGQLWIVLGLMVLAFTVLWFHRRTENFQSIAERIMEREKSDKQSMALQQQFWDSIEKRKNSDVMGVDSNFASVGMDPSSFFTTNPSLGNSPLQALYANPGRSF